MSTLVIGQRRIGKTSLLHQFRWLYAADVFPRATFVYLDAETIHGEDPNDFLSSLLSAVSVSPADDSKSIDKYLAAQPKERRWTLPVLQSVMEQVAESRGSVVLLLDETDYLARTSPKAAMLLRSLVSTRHLLAVCATFRSPDQLKTEEGASPWANVFTLDTIGMLQQADAEDMLERLSFASGNRLSHEEIRFLLEMFGPHPFRLQTAGVVLFEATAFNAARAPGTRRLLLSDATREATSRLERHILYDFQHLTADEIKILTQIAHGGDVKSNRALESLRDQGIIGVIDNTWSITSRVIAEFIAQLPDDPSETQARATAVWEFVSQLGKKALATAMEKAIDVAARKWLA